jgi:hypothetical protein
MPEMTRSPTREANSFANWIDFIEIQLFNFQFARADYLPSIGT